MLNKLNSLILLAIFILPLTILAQDDDELAQANHYNIVYLIAEDATVAEVVNPQTIRETFDADIVHSWEEVVFYEDLLGIDALIIHVSAVELIDATWLIRQHNLGLVVTAFNVSSEIFAELVGREGLRDRYTLVEDDTVFITASIFNVRSVLDGTGLSGVAIESYGMSRVDVLSTEEGQFALTLLLEDIQTLRDYKHNLINDLLDNPE